VFASCMGVSNFKYHHELWPVGISAN